MKKLSIFSLLVCALLFAGLTSQVSAQITGPGGAGVPGGTPNQVQYNNAGAFGGFTVGGDGTLPPGTGLLNITALNGQAVALAGALTTVGAFATTLTTTGATALTLPVSGTLAILGANTFTGQQINSTNGAASTPPLKFTGTIFSGGTATTTKPHILIEPTGNPSAAWNTLGTGLGFNFTTGYTGLAVDGQINGLSFWTISASGNFVGNSFLAGTSGAGAGVGYQNTGIFSGTASGAFSLGLNVGTSDTFWTRKAAANWRMGQADVAAPVAQTLSVQGVAAGTSNTAGVNTTYKGSQGTGTGIGGSIIFQVSPPGTTGTAQNAYVTGLTIDGTTGYPILPAATTVALLPVCNAAARGALGQVSDATVPTYNGALTGGGAVFVPVYCNGAAWTSH